MFWKRKKEIWIGLAMTRILKLDLRKQLNIWVI